MRDSRVTEVYFELFKEPAIFGGFFLIAEEANLDNIYRKEELQ
jgi:hypothetical protein